MARFHASSLDKNGAIRIMARAEGPGGIIGDAVFDVTKDGAGVVESE